MTVSIDLIRSVVNEKMSSLSNEKKEEIIELIVETSGFHPKCYEKYFNEITGGDYNLYVILQMIHHRNHISELKLIGVKYYKWLSGDCPAKGHKKMEGKICSIEDNDCYYVRGAKKSLKKKERTKLMPIGSPADCEKFCNCSFVMFDPDIDF